MGTRGASYGSFYRRDQLLNFDRTTWKLPAAEMCHLHSVQALLLEQCVLVQSPPDSTGTSGIYVGVGSTLITDLHP